MRDEFTELFVVCVLVLLLMPIGPSHAQSLNAQEEIDLIVADMTYHFYNNDQSEFTL